MTDEPKTSRGAAGDEAIDARQLHWGLTDATVRVEVVESAAVDRGYGALVGFDAAGRAVDLLGEDGGEPEDQTLYRDWAWVPDMANALLDKIARLTRERDEAERLLLALVIESCGNTVIHELQRGILCQEACNAAEDYLCRRGFLRPIEDGHS